MGYYTWRNLASIMDDFHPTDFPVTFGGAKGLLFFHFQRGDHERMVGAWINGPEKDGIAQIKPDLTLPDVRATQVTVVDITNGTEQELDFTNSGSDTVVKGVLIKDYPVLIRLRL